MRNSTTKEIQKSLQDLDPGSLWYQRIVEKLHPYTDLKDPRLAKKFRLDQLLRFARRVDGFSGTCDDCRNYKSEISGMVDELGNTIQANDKSTMVPYFNDIDSIKKHLKETHHLLDDHHYLTLFSSIGTALAIGTSTALGDFRYAAYAAVIACIGAGFCMDRKAKKEGRTL